MKTVVDPSLRGAFEAARYHVRIGRKTWTLRPGARHRLLDRRLGALGCERRWHLITACNPLAQPLADAENARRQRQLRDELASLGLRTCDSIATDPGGGWREPGYLALDGDDAAIDALGRRHGQLALLRSTPGDIAELHWL